MQPFSLNPTLAARVLVLSLAAGCRPGTGTLEGDLYLRTADGLVKHGAAETVLLLPDSASFAAGWRAVCDSLERVTEAQRADEGAEFERIVSLRDRVEHRQVRAAMLRDAMPYQAATGITAHYRFAGVPSGSYWLFAELVLGEYPYSWWHRVTISAGDSLRVDLDNGNVLDTPLTCEDDLPITSADDRARNLAAKEARRRRATALADSLAEVRLDSIAAATRRERQRLDSVYRAGAANRATAAVAAAAEQQATMLRAHLRARAKTVGTPPERTVQVDYPMAYRDTVRMSEAGPFYVMIDSAFGPDGKRIRDFNRAYGVRYADGSEAAFAALPVTVGSGVSVVSIYLNGDRLDRPVVVKVSAEGAASGATAGMAPPRRGSEEERREILRYRARTEGTPPERTFTVDYDRRYRGTYRLADFQIYHGAVVDKVYDHRGNPVSSYQVRLRVHYPDGREADFTQGYVDLVQGVNRVEVFVNGHRLDRLLTIEVGTQ